MRRIRTPFVILLALVVSALVGCASTGPGVTAGAYGS